MALTSPIIMGPLDKLRHSYALCASYLGYPCFFLSSSARGPFSVTSKALFFPSHYLCTMALLLHSLGKATTIVDWTKSLHFLDRQPNH